MFEQVRSMAINTASAVASGALDPGRGLAVAACLKVVNDSVVAEVKLKALRLQAKSLGIENPMLLEGESQTHQPAVIDHQPEPLIDTSGMAAALNVPEVQQAPKKRPPSILVLGMRPTQLGRVTEKLNGTADLFSWTTDDGHLVLRSLAKRADLIVMASGGAVNHSDTEALARDGLTWEKAQNSHASVLSTIKAYFSKENL